MFLPSASTYLMSLFVGTTSGRSRLSGFSGPLQLVKLADDLSLPFSLHGEPVGKILAGKRCTVLCSWERFCGTVWIWKPWSLQGWPQLRVSYRGNRLNEPNQLADRFSLTNSEFRSDAVLQLHLNHLTDTPIHFHKVPFKANRNSKLICRGFHFHRHWNPRFIVFCLFFT